MGRLKPALDCRVELKGARGFVRFMGALPGRGDDVIWLGIDWDDPSRGKHDGTVDGVRHFIASYPTSGSFVKASKFHDSPRRTFLDAAVDRHSVCEEEGKVAKLADHTGNFSARSAKSFSNSIPELPTNVGGVGGRTAFLGLEDAVLRQTQLAEAKRLTLRGLGVCSVGDPCELASALPRLRTLDLANSLLANVQDIVGLFRGLPQLESLDVSGNRFHVGDNTASSIATAVRHSGSQDGIRCAVVAKSLRILVLNRCNLPWNMVLAICGACPFLEELRLHRSSLSSLHEYERSCNREVSSSQILRNLRLVDVDGNCLRWNDILAAFGDLPHLQCIFAGANDVRHIPFCSSVDSPKFPCLRSVSLSGNPIHDWSSISALSALSKLESLRVMDIPLLRDDENRGATMSSISRSSGSRNGIIARLGELTSLNGSHISKDERMYAEKRYMNQCLTQARDLKNPNAIFSEHPRLQSLCKEYGLGIDAEGNLEMPASETGGSYLSNGLRVPGDQGYQPLRMDLVYCSFINKGKFKKGYPEVMKVELPLSISVGRLAGLAARLFGGRSAVDVGRLELVDNTGDSQRRLSQLDDETRDLRYYGLTGGDAICINVMGRCIG